jgi:hypothetical protein
MVNLCEMEILAGTGILALQCKHILAFSASMDTGFGRL